MKVLRVGEDALLVEVSSGDQAQALHAELLRLCARIGYSPPHSV